MNFSHRGQGRRTNILLAPAGAVVPAAFRNVTDSPRLHHRLLASMQRLRGHIYSGEGAISRASLTSDGRHVQTVDDQSWHLLTVGDGGQVVGCARFHAHSLSARWEHVGVSRAWLAKDPHWAASLRRAVEREMDQARALGMAFVEAGGWALAESIRHTPEAIKIALSAFCWAKLLGGAVGVTTATVRNQSAMILQRLGGSFLESDGRKMPMYFDPQYGCEMAILRFSDASYSVRYHKMVRELTDQLSNALVLTPGTAGWETFANLHPAVYDAPMQPLSRPVESYAV
ncbi:MAG: hypothetical protein H7039_10320 [Bryobacteraceae bacterium]|nr:hypothetical protein [Bryobacteraceae bacterium]